MAANTESSRNAVDKAEEGTAAVQSAVLLEPSLPRLDSPLQSATSVDSSLTPRQQQEVLCDAAQLEQLAIVPSGPVYSAFTQRQKNYIVFMVTCALFPVS